MHRRDFISASVAAGAAAMSSAASPRKPGVTPFRLKYAPHFGMFRNLANDDPIDQLKFAADQGFTAWEDNGMAGRPVAEQERIGKALTDLGMTFGVFVVSMDTAWGPHFVEGKEESRELFLKDCRAAVEVAQRVNATWMTVVPGTMVPNLEMGYQTANVVDQLRRGAEIFEPHGLVMVLEALNPWRDHPGQFLSKIPQAFEVCRAVNSPSCKILFDLYHQQVTEGNLIPNIYLAWNEIAYFQIGDNPGRCEPGTGEINYKNVFGHIHAKGYDGVLGMEHGASIRGAEGETAVIDAYRAADTF
ncbi:MAG: TIM barrel protein [Phycisphaerales bacterium]|nr:TIM barrel protein [Phycisphaerales bacterium]